MVSESVTRVGVAVIRVALESKRLFAAIRVRSSAMILRLRQWYVVPVVMLLSVMHITHQFLWLQHGYDCCHLL